MDKSIKELFLRNVVIFLVLTLFIGIALFVIYGVSFAYLYFRYVYQPGSLGSTPTEWHISCWFTGIGYYIITMPMVVFVHKKQIYELEKRHIWAATLFCGIILLILEEPMPYGLSTANWSFFIGMDYIFAAINLGLFLCINALRRFVPVLKFIITIAAVAIGPALTWEFGKAFWIWMSKARFP